MQVAYDIHGVTFGGDVDRAVGDALDRRLVAFRTGPITEPAVRLEFGAQPLLPPPGSSRLVYQSPGVQVRYFEEAGELYVDHPAGARLRCHPAAGLARFSLPPDDRSCVSLATHPMFTVAMIEVLKQRGRFSVHAGCAAVGDRAVLVAGPSGAGKSTLAVAMARAGMAFMADDTVFITRSAGTVEVLGFPDEVDLTDQTLAMYPELAGAAQAPTITGREKRSLRLEDALPVTMALRGRPAALVLPTVAHTDHSRLVPISEREAVLSLAPNVLLTEPAAAQAHLDILQAMARSTACFRLDTGTDLDQVSDLLASLTGPSC